MARARYLTAGEAERLAQTRAHFTNCMQRADGIEAWSSFLGFTVFDVSTEVLDASGAVYTDDPDALFQLLSDAADPVAVGEIVLAVIPSKPGAFLDLLESANASQALVDLALVRLLRGGGLVDHILRQQAGLDLGRQIISRLRTRAARLPPDGPALAASVWSVLELTHIRVLNRAPGWDEVVEKLSVLAWDCLADLASGGMDEVLPQRTVDRLMTSHREAVLSHLVSVAEVRRARGDSFDELLGAFEEILDGSLKDPLFVLQVSPSLERLTAATAACIEVRRGTQGSPRWWARSLEPNLRGREGWDFSHAEWWARVRRASWLTMCAGVAAQLCDAAGDQNARDWWVARFEGLCADHLDEWAWGAPTDCPAVVSLPIKLARVCEWSGSWSLVLDRVSASRSAPSLQAVLDAGLPLPSHVRQAIEAELLDFQAFERELRW